MTKPSITVDRFGPNAEINNLIGVAHAAIMEEGFRALKESNDYLRDGELIVYNYTMLANMMKNGALNSPSYEEKVKAIEKYVTINWK